MTAWKLLSDGDRHRYLLSSRQGLDAFKDVVFDEAVTVCDPAQGACPVISEGGTKRHQNFKHPAASKGTEAEVFAAFQRVRDEIRDWIMETY